MVFEGLLVDVLNRFVGSYVKNLDASQLKVGIWNGDVVLEKLDLKENALDDLRLPIRIFGGHLDKLRLRIPWKNLYGAPVVAEVEGLYVLAGPASAAGYDAQKSAQEAKESKDKQLKKIEEARKKSAEAKAKTSEAPGFVEKLVTQIIKNVQITVKNIHVTYEDRITDPQHPFSVGVTLDSLLVQSTNSDYDIGTLNSDSTSTLVYKVISMSCLSVYWNTNATLLSEGSLPSNWADVLKSRIARSTHTELSLNYLLRPISAEAKLQLTMKPGLDKDIPQALVSLVMDHIAFSLGKQQYQNLMSLIESFDRMSINQRYLKYKPRASLMEDSRAWWRDYAIPAVMEDVKRRSNMWSWNHIKQHRSRCKKYVELYQKLLEKKVSADEKKVLEELEVELDVVNITLCRQLAENKAERQTKAKEEQKSGGGWLAWGASWVTGSSEPVVTKPPTEAELALEREKLYKALDYSTKGGAANYSREYVAHNVRVNLKKVSLVLYNEEGSVSDLLASDMQVVFMHRPAAGNIAVTASLGNLTMSGRSLGEAKPPKIVSIAQQTEGSLLNVKFELKPLTSKADVSVKAQLKPVQIIYDAETVDSIIGMFLLPKDVQLQKLSAAASSTIKEVKTQGRAGLEHSISQKKVVEVDIVLNSPYVVIPEKGTLTQSATVLLLDLGSLHVTSDAKQLDSVRKASLNELETAFYDNFSLQLNRVQVIVAGASDDWREAHKLSTSPLHILTPTHLDIVLKKSLIEDSQYPKIKVSGELPVLKLSLSDKKVKQVLKIVQSLPLPPPSLATQPVSHHYSYESTAKEMDPTDLAHTLSATLLDKAEPDPVSSDEEGWFTPDEGDYDEHTSTWTCPSGTQKRPSSTSEDQKDQNQLSATNLLLDFNIPKILIEFSEYNVLNDQDVMRLDLAISAVTAKVEQKTWELGVAAFIGNIAVNDHFLCTREGVVGDKPIPLLKTVTTDEQEFLSFKYTKAARDGPAYKTRFKTTGQSIAVSLSLIKLELHRESLVNLLGISKSITADLKSSKKDGRSEKPQVSKSADKLTSASQSSVFSESGDKELPRLPGEKDLSVEAGFSGIEVVLSDCHGELLSANIKGLKTSVAIDEQAIRTHVSLFDVSLLNSDPSSAHPTVIDKMNPSEHVASTDVVLFKNTDKEDLSSVDLSVEAVIKQLKVIAVFKFLTRIKVFVSEFLDQLKLDQGTIDSAKQAAADTAARTVQEQHAGGQRVRLAVTLEAPQIIVPLSSTSMEAVVADLGVLDLENSFHKVEQWTSGESPPLYETLDINLNNLKVYRALLSNEAGVTKSDILQPFNLTLAIHRNLSSSWYTDIPTIKIKASLGHLKMSASNGDIESLCGVLTGNLREGIATPTKPKNIEELPVDPVEGPEDDEQPKSPTVEDKQETSSKNFIALALEASLKSIEIELFKCKNCDWKKGPDTSLASLTLHEFTSGVTLESSGAMALTVEMMNCLLDDQRPHMIGKSTRLIQKVVGGDSDSPLVTVRFTKSSTSDTSLTCKVESVQVLLDLVFIFILVDYFKTTLSVLTRPDSSAEPPSPVEDVMPPSPGPPPTAPGDKPPAKLTVTLNVSRPLIALLENAEDLNSRALVVGSQLDLSMEQEGDAMELEAEISALAIFSANLTNLRNTSCKVLKPNKNSITAKLSRTKEKGTDIKVKIPDLFMTLSPTTVRLVLHVVHSIPAADKETAMVVRETAPLDLWDNKPLDNNSWYLSPPEDIDDMETSVDKPSKGSFIETPEKLEVCMEGLVVLVEQRMVSSASSAPVLALKMGKFDTQALKLTVKNWSSQLWVESAICVEASYYNLRQDVWEPLLEPSVHPGNENSYIPWSLKATVTRNNLPGVGRHGSLSSHRSSSSASLLTNLATSKQDDLPPDLSVEITSETPLRLTLTKSCMRVIKDLQTVYTERDEKAKETQEVEETDSALPPEIQDAVFIVRNQLGPNHQVTIKTKSTLKAHGAYSATLKNGASVPLHPVQEVPPLKPGEYLPREDYKKRRVHIVTLEVIGYKPIDVALGTSACVYYPLTLFEKASSSKKKSKDSQFGLVVEIVTNHQQRVPEVRIRSPLQIVNNLSESVEVLWSVESNLVPLVTVTGSSTHCLPLKATGSNASGLFIRPIYSESVPSNNSFSWTSKDKSFDIACHSNNRSGPGDNPRCRAFFVHVTINDEQYTKQPAIALSNRAHHVFVLNYPLVLQNLLPLAVSVTESTSCSQERQLGKGEKIDYSHVALSEDPKFMTRLTYNGRDWAGEVGITRRSSDYVTFSLSPEDSVDSPDSSDPSDPGADLELTLRKEEMGSWLLTLYCPYWIVNKTGLSLEYTSKQSDAVTVHPLSLPMALFPYKEAKVRVVLSSGGHSDWSKPFSLDAAGSEGVFQCLDKNSNQEYQMGTSVATSKVGLPKLITISPVFMALNQTRDKISFKISGDKLNQIYTVEPQKLLTFWPPSGLDHMTLAVNNPHMTVESEVFKFTETSSRLVRTHDTVPAVVTEVQVTGSANVITFDPYYEGIVPVMLVNHTDYQLEFQQASTESALGVQVIPGESAVYYSWPVPTAATKEICWRISSPDKKLKMKKIPIKDEGGKFKIPRSLLPRSSSTASLTSQPGEAGQRGSVSDWEESTDGADYQEWEEETLSDIEEGLSDADSNSDPDAKDFTDFSVKSGLKKVFNKISRRKDNKKGNGRVGYWVSFMDGLQRVVLFTTSSGVWHNVSDGQKTERAQMEISLSLRDVGLSLVNDERGLEIAYIGIPPSKPMWQTLKRWNRWKPVKNELSEKLEQVINQDVKGDVKIFDVPNSPFKIDFSQEDAWCLVDKSGVKTNIRRSQFEGISLHVTRCDHMTSIEAKINEVQIDNHLPFTSNPLILYTYPTSPTIASIYEPKPFIEGSVIIQVNPKSTIKQVQLAQVLVQEIGLNVDMNFILAITNLLDKLPSRVTESESIEADLEHSRLPLEKSKVEQVSAASTRNYFKLLHLSPLDIHLSFNLNRDGSYKPDQDSGMTMNPVIAAVINTITQFAVIIGRTKDAELQLGYFEVENVALTQSALFSRITKHYTQQAALQMYSVVLGLEVLGNPVGFVKGFKDGAIGLFYHPIQGAVLGPGEFFEGLALGGRQFFSGTLGGLSGAVGKVSGVLGDAAAKLTMDDEYQEHRRRRGGGDSVGRSLVGAGKGVLTGITGVFTQPIKGAKEEGALGVFKGLGKGLLGVVLRPTAGLLDFTSATFNAVQKKSKVGDFDVAQLRPARYIGPERIIFPYSLWRASGYALFMEVDNGRLADTDTFFDHVELVEKPLQTLLITYKQVAVVKHNSLLGRFDDEFSLQFTELTAPVWADSETSGDKTRHTVVMPVREETFGLGFISGKKSFKNEERTLTVESKEIAEKCVNFINQAYEDFRATATLSDT